MSACLLVLTLDLVDGGVAHAQSWEQKAKMPAAREKVATCVIGPHIYVIGGATTANGPGLDTNERYDTLTDSWAAMAPMPTPRRELTASVVDEKCYVIGGSTGIRSTEVSVLEIYDPATNQWSAGADMPTARFFPVSAAIDGLIYVAGGAGASFISNDLQVYDPTTNSWMGLSPMPTPRAASAAAVLGGKFYVFGGTNDPFSQRFAVSEVYDPVTDIWSSIASMPQALAAFSAAVVGGKVFVTGGSTADFAGVNTVNVFDPASNTWSVATPLPTTRSIHGTAYVDGDLFVIGGALSNVVPHDAIDSVLSLQVDAELPFQPINAGMSDAWFDPATDGQGFLITVFPDTGIVFLAWFTYDIERPDPSAEAILGEPGHRWLTAQGPYSNGVAVLDVVMTSGGVFDSPEPGVTTDAEYGAMTVEWQDCESATLEYDLVDPDVQGTISLERVASDRVPLCEALSGD